MIRKHLLTSETSSLALDRWEPSPFPAGTVSCLCSNPQWQLHGSDVEISPLHPSISTSQWGSSSTPPGGQSEEADGQRRPQLNSVKTLSSPSDFARIGRSGSRAKHDKALPADYRRMTEVKQLKSVSNKGRETKTNSNSCPQISSGKFQSSTLFTLKCW